MQLENENPAALAGASRVEDTTSLHGTGLITYSIADAMSFQATYVSTRYRLSPCMARLVCQLAEIGGRLA